MKKALTQEQKEFLQDVYNRALSEGTDTIYQANVPRSFYVDGDEGVWAQPLEDSLGVCGVHLEHNYLDEGEWFSWGEDFPMREIVPLR